MNLYEPFIQNRIAEFSKEISMLIGEPTVFEPKFPEPLTPEEVFEHVCTTLELDKDFVRSASRKTEVVEASQIAAVLIRDNFKSTLKEVGRIIKFKPMDHSSILHKYKQHEDWIQTDMGYRRKFNKCKI